MLAALNGSADGDGPQSNVVVDEAGTVYGGTLWGGHYDQGVVFKLDTSSKSHITLHTFTGGMDGGSLTSLLRDKAGNLYGTAASGGIFHEGGGVFEMDTNGNERMLYSFAGGTMDGCGPGGLIQDKEGNFYGVTWACGTYNFGTVFKLSKTGQETLLHSFGGPDGAYPDALFRDAKGDLYGTAESGGDSPNCDDFQYKGCGVVYKLSSSGKFTVLHSFSGGALDGCFAQGAPIMDKHRNLYGIAELCGSSGLGIIWKLSLDGTETILHDFAGAPADGSAPAAGVIMDAEGSLYGVTVQGGNATQCGENGHGCGTVYKLSKNGKITLLHSFDGYDGSFPYGGITRDALGNFYGTTMGGGGVALDNGTAWEIIK